jgi:hypothetical protein
MPGEPTVRQPAAVGAALLVEVASADRHDLVGVSDELAGDGVVQPQGPFRLAP